MNLGARLLGNKLIGQLVSTDDKVLRFWTEISFRPTQRVLLDFMFLTRTNFRGGDGGTSGGVGSGESSSEKVPTSLRTSQSERLGMKSSSSDSGWPGGVIYGIIYGRG